MYEDATREELPLDERLSNWTQKFDRDDDASLFVVSQFSRYQKMEERLKENFGNPSQYPLRMARLRHPRKLGYGG